MQELVSSSIRLIVCISSNNWRLKCAWLNKRVDGNLAKSGLHAFHFRRPNILVRGQPLTSLRPPA